MHARNKQILSVPLRSELNAATGDNCQALIRCSNKRIYLLFAFVLARALVDIELEIHLGE